MASLWNKSVITCLLGAYSRYTPRRHVITNTYKACIPRSCTNYIQNTVFLNILVTTNSYVIMIFLLLSCAAAVGCIELQLYAGSIYTRDCQLLMCSRCTHSLRVYLSICCTICYLNYFIAISQLAYTQSVNSLHYFLFTVGSRCCRLPSTLYNILNSTTLYMMSMLLVTCIA